MYQKAVKDVAHSVRTQIFNFGPDTKIIPSIPPTDANIDTIYECKQCRYIGGCTDIACTYADLCDKHATTEYGCEVKQSTIPNAGLGLFATTPFDKGDCVDLYEGERYPSSDNKCRPYGLLVVEHSCIVDSASTQSCISRYINHNPEKANCGFIRFSPRKGVILTSVLTLKRIETGEELFIDYGSHYRDFFKSKHIVSVCET